MQYHMWGFEKRAWCVLNCDITGALKTANPRRVGYFGIIVSIARAHMHTGEAHSLMSSSQLSPVKPALQLQVYMLSPSLHVPCVQGFDVHSSFLLQSSDMTVPSYTITLKHPVWLCIVAASGTVDAYRKCASSFILAREFLTGFKLAHERSCFFIVNISPFFVRTAASRDQYTVSFTWIVCRLICFPEDGAWVGQFRPILPPPVTVDAVSAWAGVSS